MEKKQKVKNKRKLAFFLMVAGGAFVIKLAVKIGMIHALRTWFESIFLN
ncbi:histidine kinase [Bacillus cytotoxicus]|nr:histidine kinase [Bacillus cereus group sp. BfR-BA-01492]EMA6343676.1 histidine kinase [Bacillus cytotoxicus]